jgi:hypothetical protein
MILKTKTATNKNMSNEFGYSMNIRAYKTWIQIAIWGGFVAKIWTNLLL